MIFNQSGGTSLNFKVVKNPQPANPSENTIWVNTDQKITGSYFQSTQPEDMAEGEVWISTGRASTVAFNAAKKGTIMVYPISARQMVAGALVNVTAKSYQDGKWVDWIAYIVSDGVAQGYGFSTDVRTGSGMTITKANGYIRVKPAVNKGSAIVTDEKFDLSNVSTIYADLELTNLQNSAVYDVFKSAALAVFEGNSYADAAGLVGGIVRYKNHNSTGRTVISVDVSDLTGEYYVGVVIGSGATPTTADIYNLLGTAGQDQYEQIVAEFADLEAAFNYLKTGGVTNG